MAIFPQNTPANPYLSGTSLLDLKIQRLRERTAEKTNKFADVPTDQAPADPQMSIREMAAARTNTSSGAGLLDLAESSIYQSQENISNFLTGQSNPNAQAEADARAGYTGREDLQGRQQEAITGIAQGRNDFNEGNYLKGLASYGGAALDTLKMGPELLADSAGSVVEGAAGVAMTALPEAASSVAGVTLLGKKLRAAESTVSGISKAIDEAQKAIKAGKKVGPVEKALVKSTKAVSQTSFMTANVLQNMKEDYIAENNGETPNAGYWAVNAPIAIALNTVQLGIFKKFFLPSKAGVKKDIQGIKNYVKDMTEILDPIPKSYSKKVATTILGKARDVSAAAGAEAGQEYLQSWHEILATKMDGLSLDSAIEELSSGSNQDQTLFGAFAGAAAGGTGKGIAVAPKAALEVGAETALGVTQSAVQVAKKQAIRGSLKLLSPEERVEISENYNVKKEAFDVVKAKKEQQIKDLDKITSLDSVSDKEILADLNKAKEKLGITTSEMKDPDVFNEIKNKVKKDYNATVFLSRESLERSRAGMAAKMIGKNIANEVKEVALRVAKKEDIDKAVEKLKEFGVDVQNTVKGLKTSAAVGIVERGTLYGANITQSEIDKIVKTAEKLSFKDLKKSMLVLKSTNPKLHNALKSTYKIVERRTKRFKQSNIEINKDNISPVLKSVTTAGEINSESEVLVEDALLESFEANSITDLESLKILEKAVNLYSKSKRIKNKKSRLVKKSDIAIYRKRIAEMKADFGEFDTRLGKFDNKVNKLADVAKDFIKNMGIEESPEKKQADIDNENTTEEQNKPLVERLKDGADRALNSKLVASIKNVGTALAEVTEAIGDKIDVAPLQALEKRFNQAESMVDKQEIIVEVLGLFNPENPNDSASVSRFAMKLFKEGKIADEDPANFVNDNFRNLGQYVNERSEKVGQAVVLMLLQDIDKLILMKETADKEAAAIKAKDKADQESNNDQEAKTEQEKKTNADNDEEIKAQKQVDLDNEINDDTPVESKATTKSDEELEATAVELGINLCPVNNK